MNVENKAVEVAKWHNMRTIVRKVPSDAESCDICRKYKNFLEVVSIQCSPQQNPAIVRKMRGLAKGNLNRHLRTGKHFKELERFVEEV